MFCEAMILSKKQMLKHAYIMSINHFTFKKYVGTSVNFYTYIVTFIYSYIATFIKPRNKYFYSS